jgi:hypothetical protein
LGHSLANSSIFFLILFFLVVSPVVLLSAGYGSSQSSYPIFGYAQHTYGGMSTGGDYSYYGTSFTLAGDATITSISAEMAIRYSPSRPDIVSHYRYAIYKDNGAAGELVAQTEIGSEKPEDGNPLAYDKFWTLNLPSPVTLHAGNYWLISMDDSQLVEMHTEQTTQVQRGIWGNFGGMDFPVSLDTGNLAPYNNAVFAIYASGQGTVSTLSPPGPDASNPNVAFITIACQNANDDVGSVQIVGSLNVYGGGISQATIDFAYRDSANFTYQPFTQTVTASDGSFTLDWIPPTAGNYVINATYWGSDLYTSTFKELNVLVAPATGNISQTVFSVDSNSTVSDLAFNSDSDELSFSVAGETGTLGYVDVCIGKSLVENASAIHAFIDGVEAAYTVSEMGNSWIFHFTYHHSSHDIKFDLAGTSESSAVPEMTQETTPLVVAVLVIVLVFAAVVVIAQKRK